MKGLANPTSCVVCLANCALLQLPLCPIAPALACGTQFKETQIELVQKPIELPAAEAKIACLGDQVEITDSESYRFYFWDGHKNYKFFFLHVKRLEKKKIYNNFLSNLLVLIQSKLVF